MKIRLVVHIWVEAAQIMSDDWTNKRFNIKVMEGNVFGHTETLFSCLCLILLALPFQMGRTLSKESKGKIQFV